MYSVVLSCKDAFIERLTLVYVIYYFGGIGGQLSSAKVIKATPNLRQYSTWVTVENEMLSE
jgi:hypothetical protein